MLQIGPARKSASVRLGDVFQQNILLDRANLPTQYAARVNATRSNVLCCQARPWHLKKTQCVTLPYTSKLSTLVASTAQSGLVTKCSIESGLAVGICLAQQTYQQTARGNLKPRSLCTLRICLEQCSVLRLAGQFSRNTPYGMLAPVQWGQRLTRPQPSKRHLYCMSRNIVGVFVASASSPVCPGNWRNKASSHQQ